VYPRLSWQALVELSAVVGRSLETRILAGDRIGGPRIRAVRLAHAQRTDQPAQRITA
jgi:hypothetical protein